MLAKLGVLRWLLRVVGVAGAGRGAGGFRVVEAGCSRGPIGRGFFAVILVLFGLGFAAGLELPWLAVLCGAALLFLGVTACLAYMFIDLERYEVGRGYKAVHNPLKGQALAVNPVRYAPMVGVPSLAGAPVAADSGFAMLNEGLYHTVGQNWFSLGAEKPPRYLDFLAYPLVHLFRIVDLMAVASENNYLKGAYVLAVAWPAKAMLSAFKAFFTLVLLQQLFASMRRGKLLSETIAEFWSPHEPIAERARLSLPQHGLGAVRPLLLSLRSIEFLTKEQRDQIPQVLADIGPAALPILIAHLRDSHENVRAVAAGAVGRLHALDALPALVKMRRDSSEWVRESMVEALGRIGGASWGLARRRRLLGRALGAPSRLLAWVVRRPTPPAPSGNAAELIDRAVFTLRAALTDPATAVRTQAARALGLIGPAASASAPELIDLLRDENETVRCQAAESLGKVEGSPEKVVAALVGLLQDVSQAVRAAAARTLGSLKGKAEEAVPALVPLLQDREESVRQAAAEAVGRIGTLNGDATPKLVEGLGSADNVVRAETAEALGSIGETAVEATPALVQALKDANDRVRAKAAEALGKIGEGAAEAVPSLVHALRDKDNWVSAMAAEALGQMGESADDAIPALVRSLDHINPQVRANAAEALGKMGEVAAISVPALEKAAQDEDAGVRAHVVRALGAVARAATEQRILLGATEDADPSVRAAAVEALGKRGETNEEIVGALLRALLDPTDPVKVEATKAVPRLAGPTEPAIDGLCALLDADNAWVQVHAALGLGRLGPPAVKAGQALLRAAQTAELSVREQAMRALVMIQPPEVGPALAAGLKDASSEIRKVASAGLMKAATVPLEVVPQLTDALRDPEVQVRANAAHALARLDVLPADAVAALIECTVDPRDDLRMNATLALCKAPAARVSDLFAQRVGDPNPRIRLIAARFLLMQDPANAEATAVVTAALVDADHRLRKSAIDLIDSLGSQGAGWGDALRQQVLLEEEPGLRESLSQLLERLKSEAVPETPIKAEALRHYGTLSLSEPEA